MTSNTRGRVYLVLDYKSGSNAINVFQPPYHTAPPNMVKAVAFTDVSIVSTISVLRPLDFASSIASLSCEIISQSGGLVTDLMATAYGNFGGTRLK